MRHGSRRRLSRTCNRSGYAERLPELARPEIPLKRTPMKLFFVALLLASASLVCAADLSTLKTELIKADKDFCALSVKEGPSAAFLANLALNGTLLATSGDLQGEAAIKDIYGNFPKSANLRWTPVFADVAASG